MRSTARATSPHEARRLQERLDALDTWRHWANCRQLSPTQVNEMNTGLFVANDSIHEFFALRAALFHHPRTAVIIQHVEHGIDRSRGLELSID